MTTPTRLWATSVLLAAGLGASAAPGGATTTSHSKSLYLARMYSHRGQYFDFATPAGWRVDTESANNLTLVSQDQHDAVMLTLMIGGFGRVTPEQFLQYLGSISGYSNGKVQNVRHLPQVQPGLAGVEAQFTCSIGGQSVRGELTCVVQNFWTGKWTGYCLSHFATPDRWARDRGWLKAVASTVSVWNWAQIGHQDQVMQGQNRPLASVFGESTVDWENRGRTYAKIAQQRSEGILGYTRALDPATGRVYEPSFNQWNASRGGFVNPVRRDELLVPIPPGQ